jgi:hypothetical protein
MKKFFRNKKRKSQSSGDEKGYSRKDDVPHGLANSTRSYTPSLKLSLVHNLQKNNHPKW